MRLVFLDLEFNRLSNKQRRKINNIMPSEIIDFGCIVTDFQFNIIAEMNYIVKPEYQKKLDPYIKKLTGITDNQLKHALYFSLCMNRFKQICGDKFYIITWGDEDVKVLTQNCKLKKIKYDFLKNVINFNAQKAHQIFYNLDNPTALKKVKKILDVPSSKQHRAYDDTLDLISICKEIGISNVLSKEAIVDNREFKPEIIDMKLKRANKIWNKEYICFNCESSNTEIIREVKPHFEFKSKMIRGIQLIKCKDCGSLSLQKVSFSSTKKKGNTYIKKYYEENNKIHKQKIEHVMKTRFYNTTG